MDTLGVYGHIPDVLMGLQKWQLRLLYSRLFISLIFEAWRRSSFAFSPNILRCRVILEYHNRSFVSAHMDSDYSEYTNMEITHPAKLIQDANRRLQFESKLPKQLFTRPNARVMKWHWRLTRRTSGHLSLSNSEYPRLHLLCWMLADSSLRMPRTTGHANP